MTTAHIAQRRIYAWLIDVLLVVGVSIPLPLVSWLISPAYILLRDGLFEGQSVGKRIMGLKVVAHSARLQCTYLDSVVRNILWVIPVVNLAVGLTGLNYLLHDPKGRHWGDRLANTEVVSAERVDKPLES